MVMQPTDQPTAPTNYNELLVTLTRIIIKKKNATPTKKKFSAKMSRQKKKNLNAPRHMLN